MRVTGLTIAFLVAGLFESVIAAALHPEDFAAGFDIEVNGNAPLITVPLTEPVYAASATERLRDIAVFNVQGEPVPYLLGPKSGQRRENRRSRVELPIYPVPERTDDDRSSVTIEAGGALVRIEGGDVLLAGGIAMRYLVDASHISGRVAAIEITLAQDHADFVSTVTIEGSDDLNRWRPLVTQHGLANLRYGGHLLSQLRVPFSNRTSRYLRLRFPDGGPTPSIAGVTAELLNSSVEDTPTQRRVVAGTLIEGEPEAIHFDTGASFPLTTIGFNLPPNNLFEGVLQSRNTVAASWRTHHRGVFYALERQGLLLRPKPIAAGGSRDRYWRLSGISPNSASSSKIEMEIRWRPENVTFLAQGSPPYTLAAGRHSSRLTQPQSAAGLKKIYDPKLAGVGSIGQQRELGSSELRTGSQEIPWQRLGLWSILVFGVAVAAVMVLRLTRQMRD